MERISYTFSLMRSSWEVLKKDKELLVFPVLSGICCLIVLLSFLVPMLASGLPTRAQVRENPVLYYALMFLFYLANYFVVIFFNSAVVACAIFRMRGGNPNLATGFNAAVSRLPQIVGWAIVAATVGMILRILENRSRRGGRILIGIIGMAWSVLTFLVVPILVVEKKGPIEAIKRSASLLKRTWGEQLVGNFSFGLIFFLLALAAVIPIWLGALASVPALRALLIGIGVAYLIAVALVQSVLQTIFQAAVYLYAHDGRAPAGFAEQALGNAVAPAGNESAS